MEENMCRAAEDLKIPAIEGTLDVFATMFQMQPSEQVHIHE
jgi:hypothetical protein